MRHLRYLYCFAALAVSCHGAAAREQAPSPGAQWPVRPVRFIVPYAPGGATDIIGRLVAQKLGELLGQQFVVENRPGAGASIGANLVATAVPDGYTLLLTNSGSHAAAPALFPKLPYDPIKNFTHVALVATTPTVLVVNKHTPFRTLESLVRYAKANPGKLSFATSGNGSSAHLVGEMLMLEAGIGMVHIPYRGAGPAMLDVVANQVPMMFDSLGSASTNIRSGEVRALAVSSAARQNGFPDVPTFSESGLPNVESTSWFGVSGPAGLPPEIRKKLARAVVDAVNSPDVQARLGELQFTPSSISPAEFPAFIQHEAARWKTTVQRAGIKL